MYRKEVMVAGKVFDLGLKGLADAIKEGRQVELEVNHTVFQVGVLRKERAFALHWTGMTNVPNCLWQRFVVLRWRWPVVKTLSCFTGIKEDIR